MANQRDLHGNAPDKSRVALLIIDCINDLDFPEGEQLLQHALPMAENIARLKQRAEQADVPIIYVNDNFGRWQSNFKNQVDHCLNDNTLGRPIVELLKPEEDDYFVLKPMHSGFYCTVLDLLLEHLEVETVVLTGIAGNICVLFTANDAYLRGYRILAPADCSASNTEQDNKTAVAQMAAVLKADVSLSAEIDFGELAKDSRRKC